MAWIASCSQGGESHAVSTKEAIDSANVAIGATYNFGTLAHPGSCMDINAGSSANGTQIQEYDCNGTAAQSFRLGDAGNGNVTLIGTASGKCVDVSASGTANGTRVQLWDCNGTGAQSFHAQDMGGGAVRFVNTNSNKCLDIAGANPANFTVVQLWDCNGTNAQSWNATALSSAPPQSGNYDVTFYVMSDSHADPTPNNPDYLLAQARAINNLAASGTAWPAQIDGSPTGFAGGKIAPPRGVVVTGDLTGWGTAPTEIPSFRSYFEKGNSSNSIQYPAYVGLGNHDLDSADRDQGTADAYRAMFWQYIDSRYKGSSAPVPVTSFDAASHSYSWDFDGVHLLMVHRFAGDTAYGRPSDLGFVANDLRRYASDGRPVFVFHHYGMDAFGTNGQWWNQQDRDTYRSLLTGYHVTADIVGHTHAAFQYTWQGLRVFQVNNAKAEINTGNNDGNGSFAVVRITNRQLDVVTCRYTDLAGHFELIGPYFSGPADPGPASAP